MCGHRHLHFNSMSQQLRRGITSLPLEKALFILLRVWLVQPIPLSFGLHLLSHVVAAQPVMESGVRHVSLLILPHSLLFTFSKNKCFKSCLCQSLKCLHCLLVCMYVHSARTTLGSHFSHSTMWVLRHQEAIKLRGRMLT